MENIFLLGFMGVGKTTVGCMLAQRLDVEFIDLDAVIEQEAQCSINQIFSQYGEGYFRNLETQVLTQLAISPAVIATGGGIVGSEENWLLMHKLGSTVYLHANWATIEKRLVDVSQRPLATNGANNELYKLWYSRLPLYNQAAQIINTDGKTANQVVDDIMQTLGVDGDNAK
ncbi:MAG: shikimate kinase [Desulfuromonas sp.]|nr:shikimate kinase [Desulfuromonas sp.]